MSAFSLAPRTLSARLLFAALLLAGLALRVLVVFSDEGIAWPDEIYQSFEPAHRLVFGYGLVAWEFVEGARNWALPGFVAFWLKLCALLGYDTPFVYVRVVKLVFVLMSLGTAWGVYRLALTLGARELPAVAAASLWALSAVPLYFGHRAMSENAAALCVVWGLALLLDRNGVQRRLLIGASLLGLATLFRLQAAIFCVGAVAILMGMAIREREQAAPWRSAGLTLLILAGWAVAFGALDAATWHDAPGAKAGGWFHSAVAYLRFNLIEEKAAEYGAEPWGYYAEHLFAAMPAVAAVLAAGGVLAIVRAPGAALLAIAFVGLHMATPHKELRFILPALPLACALAGVGLTVLTEFLERQRIVGLGTQSVATGSLSRPNLVLAALTLVVAVESAATHRSLTMGQIGSFPKLPPTTSAWDGSGAVNRLLLAASRQSDLCGLRIDSTDPGFTGGHTYLHKNAPIYRRDVQPRRPYFNYIITKGSGGGSQIVAQEKGSYLLRLSRVTQCEPYPGYDWRL